MPSNEYDAISILDQGYRDQMVYGSQQLLKAILHARKGYNPGTPDCPMKLPPDYTGRALPDYAARKGSRLSRRPSNEVVREMMERGMTSVEIAKELQCSRQMISAVMKAIQLQRRPDRQMEMIRKGLWG